MYFILALSLYYLINLQIFFIYYRKITVMLNYYQMVLSWNLKVMQILYRYKSMNYLFFYSIKKILKTVVLLLYSICFQIFGYDANLSCKNNEWSLIIWWSCFLLNFMISPGASLSIYNICDSFFRIFFNDIVCNFVMILLLL